MNSDGVCCGLSDPVELWNIQVRVKSPHVRTHTLRSREARKLALLSALCPVRMQGEGRWYPRKNAFHTCSWGSGIVRNKHLVKSSQDMVTGDSVNVPGLQCRSSDPHSPQGHRLQLHLPTLSWLAGVVRPGKCGSQICL